MSDVGLLARYPFLPGAEALLGDLKPSLSELLDHPGYEAARLLARGELEGSLEGARSTSEAWRSAFEGASPEVRVLSFLYARMLLAATSSPQLTARRWGEGVARRTSESLGRPGVPPQELVDFALALDLHARLGAEGGRFVVLSLPSFLHLSCRLREEKFRLTSQTLDRGEVQVTRELARELLQEGTRFFLAEELDPLQLDPALREQIRAKEGEFLARVASLTPTRGPGSFGPVLRPDLFPPCMREVRSLLDRAQPVAHAGRFALASFMNKVGADVEAIVDAYRSAPNFKEGVTRYQVTQIARHDGGAGYTPPDCATLIANGLCFREKDPVRPSLCADPARLKNPLNYYRLRLRSAAPASPSAPTSPARSAEGAATTSSEPARTPSPAPPPQRTGAEGPTA